MNSHVAECSVVECPHRRRCWSEHVSTSAHPERARAMHPLDHLFDRRR